MDEKMLTILYRDEQDSEIIHQYIESIDRLHELVAVKQYDDEFEATDALYIVNSEIHICPDWLETRPSIIFPVIPFERNSFLGIVYAMLGNDREYSQYLSEYLGTRLLFDLLWALINAKNCDTIFETISEKKSFADPFENYAFHHNAAIALNYGSFNRPIQTDTIEAYYQEALRIAPGNPEHNLSLKYYAIFLVDNGHSSVALRLLDEHNFNHLGDHQKYSMERAWCQAAIHQLEFFKNENRLDELKNRLWQTLQFFDNKGYKIIAAFLWLDASKIAGYQNSYAEALGYINKATNYFIEAGQVEIAAEAHMERGHLLFDWAKKDNPQFYRSALSAFQEALKVFKKEDAPSVFADIHQQLGTIYAELPDENKKRSIWAALSAASFNEALEYYTRVDFPYEYGMICTNFANAYTKYPTTTRIDNYEKALALYEEALFVRPAIRYPVERAITLLNFLEASWHVANPEGFNTERYNDMIAKANEIKKLTTDKSLIAESERHLELLQELGKNELQLSK